MAHVPSFDKKYAQLLGFIQTIRIQTEMKAVYAVNKIIINGYWQIGKRLCEDDLLQGAARRKILLKLAEDLHLEYTFLTRVMKLYRLWPELSPADAYPNVSWSHYKKLFSVKDDIARIFYLEESNNNRWNTRLLNQKINSNYFIEFTKPPEKSKTKEKKGKASVDTLKKPFERLYLYSAALEKVVDGDTLLLNIDLGFDVWKRQRIRLRGIDTPELGTPEGNEARAFVQEQLRGVIRIVIQTHKVDMYGRYVCDVYYCVGETNKEKIANEGSFLNQELINEHHAVLV